MTSIKRRMLTTKESFKHIPYRETDDHFTEISELYSLIELTNFNARSFSLQMLIFKENIKNFNELEKDKKISIILKLMDQLEVIDVSLRMNATRTILFIAQGCCDVSVDIQKQHEQARENVMLLFKLGCFTMFVDLLNVERHAQYYGKNGSSLYSGEYYNIYVILNVLYLTVEVMKYEKELETSKYKKEVDMFVNDLLNCDGESLLLTLFEMATLFSFGTKHKYPIKKILLLIWKIIIVTLGGLEDLKKQKRLKRLNAGLNNDHCSGEECESRLMKHKVSQVDLEIFICNSQITSHERNPIATERGDMLPPITEGIESLKKHLYVPLSEAQTHNANPPPRNEHIETLYKNMLPKMIVYVNSLLQIFSCNNNLMGNKFRDDDLHILGEILPPETKHCSLEHAKGHALRQVEVVNKAISGILLLLLKHFKLNHIYQFEYFSQILMSCGAMNYFSELLAGASRYISSKSENPANYYPRQSGDIGSLLDETNKYSPNDLNYKSSERNLFTCVNLLRIINKMVKWKPLRIGIFLQTVCPQTFTKTVLDNEYMSLYSLKLLKIISNYLGRKWRQNNIEIMNQIFQKVRHRLIDDWSFGPSNNTQNEVVLSAQLAAFNRRYFHEMRDKIDYEEFCTDVSKLKPPEGFHQCYDRWVDKEVFGDPFDWDSLLVNDNALKM